MRTHDLDETELIAELPKLHELQRIDLQVGRQEALRSELDDGSTKQAELERAEARLAQIKSQLSDLRGRQVDR
ncbi:MAG: hypothetical protein HUU35_07955, partial [Armatimonadetes bacterium]|nr:hypothetical protein [Armatimonadota bacterium]